MPGFGNDYLDNVLAAAKKGLDAGAGPYGQRYDGLNINGNADYFLRYALGAVFFALSQQYAKMVVFFNGIGDTELAASCARKQQTYLQWAQTLKASLVIPGDVYDREQITDVVTTQIT